jgi:hypothetical protein
MPPQQAERLLDLFDKVGNFRAHEGTPAADLMA